MRWSRLSSLFRRLLDLVVDPRLTEILVEVADIVVGAGEACPLRLRIRVGAAAFFFFQAEDGIRDADVTGVQTCALPI